MSIDLNELAGAINKIKLRFRVRRRTADEWVTNNEVLLDAEIGLETDTDKFKFGNGIDPWISLPYSGVGDPITSANAGPGISITKVYPGSPGDADWVNVSLLMHFNGDSKDSSPNRFPVATSGAPGFTTSGPKYGSGAGEITASAGYWKVADDPAFDFAGGDWTIEGWFYPVTVTIGASTFPSITAFGRWARPTGSGTSALLGVLMQDGDTFVYITDSTGATHTLRFFDFQIVSTSNSTHVSDNPHPWTQNQWNHIAVVRSGTKIHVFSNGYDCPCDHNDPNYSTTPPGGYDIGSMVLKTWPSDFLVGGAAGAFNATSFGKLDDFRVTKGVARYTADFTPPAAEFYSSDTPLIIEISNIGVRSIVAGTGVTIDTTDPYNPIVNASGGSGGGAKSPDSYPTSPTVWDDEFEYGTAVDTTGARFTGANAWTLNKTSGGGGTPAPDVGQGYLAERLTGSQSVMMIQAVPSSGDWSFVAKVKRIPITGNSGWELMAYNSGNGKSATLQLYSPNPTIAIEHGSWNTSTWAYTGASNPYTDNTSFTSVDGWMWMRIRYNSTTSTLYYGYNDSGHNTQWNEVYSELVSIYLSGLTHIGLMIVSTSKGVVDYFRRTA